MLGSFYNPFLKSQREGVLPIIFELLTVKTFLIFPLVDVMKFDTLQRNSL